MKKSGCWDVLSFPRPWTQIDQRKTTGYREFLRTCVPLKHHDLNITPHSCHFAALHCAILGNMHHKFAYPFETLNNKGRDPKARRRSGAHLDKKWESNRTPIRGTHSRSRSGKSRNVELPLSYVCQRTKSLPQELWDMIYDFVVVPPQDTDIFITKDWKWPSELHLTSAIRSDWIWYANNRFHFEDRDVWAQWSKVLTHDRWLWLLRMHIHKSTFLDGVTGKSTCSCCCSEACKEMFRMKSEDQARDLTAEIHSPLYCPKSRHYLIKSRPASPPLQIDLLSGDPFNEVANAFHQ